jgi:hypothetical protein
VVTWGASGLGGDKSSVASALSSGTIAKIYGSNFYNQYQSPIFNPTSAPTNKPTAGPSAAHSDPDCPAYCSAHSEPDGLPDGAADGSAHGDAKRGPDLRTELRSYCAPDPGTDSSAKLRAQCRAHGSPHCAAHGDPDCRAERCADRPYQPQRRLAPTHQQSQLRTRALVRVYRRQRTRP